MTSIYPAHWALKISNGLFYVWSELICKNCIISYTQKFKKQNKEMIILIIKNNNQD